MTGNYHAYRALLRLGLTAARSQDSTAQAALGQTCRKAADDALQAAQRTTGATWNDMAIELNEVATALGYPIDGEGDPS